MAPFSYDTKKFIGVSSVLKRMRAYVFIYSEVSLATFLLRFFRNTQSCKLNTSQAARKLPEFEGEIAVVTIFLLCLILGPLLVFAPQLARTKRTGPREYGTVAETYAGDLDKKWLRGARRKDELLGRVVGIVF